MDLKSAKDVDLWLTKRLERPWSSEKVVQGITMDVIVLAEECFEGLDTNTKLGFIISFLAFRKINLQKMHENIYNILKKALQDPDVWVQIIAHQIISFLCKSDPDVPSTPYHEKVLESYEKISQLESPKDVEDFYPIQYQYIDKSNSRYSEAPKLFTVNPECFTETYTFDDFPNEKPTDTKDVKNIKPIVQPTIIKNTNTPIRSSLNQTPTASTPQKKPPLRDFLDITSEPILPKKRMCMLDIDEVRELQQQNTVKRRRRNDEEAKERQRKRKEQQEEAKRKRQEEKLRKQQEAAERKIQAEREREAKKLAKQQEREAKKLAKLQQQAVKAQQQHQQYRNMNMQVSQPPSVPQPHNMARPFIGINSVPALRPILPPKMNNYQYQTPGGMNMIPYHHLGNPPNPHPPNNIPTLPTQPVAPSTEDILSSLFENANRVNDAQKAVVSDFMYGKSKVPPDPNNPISQLLLHEEEIKTDDGRLWSEQILFEINYTSGTWRKLRRRKPLQ